MTEFLIWAGLVWLCCGIWLVIQVRSDQRAMGNRRTASRFPRWFWEGLK